MNYATRVITALFLVALTACSSTKFVPEGQHLVDKVTINVIDNPSIDKKEMRNYLRQTQNHEILGGWKFQLGIYNMSGRDSSKWYNRWVRKVGQAPVIYDQALTDISASQLRLALINKGYLDTEVMVDTIRRDKKKKIRVEYNIYSHRPHYIESVD